MTYVAHRHGHGPRGVFDVTGYIRARAAGLSSVLLRSCRGRGTIQKSRPWPAGRRRDRGWAPDRIATGTSSRVWAPARGAVYVHGTFNDWAGPG